MENETKNLFELWKVVLNSPRRSAHWLDPSISPLKEYQVIFRCEHPPRKRNNSKKSWKLNDTYRDRLAEQKKIKAKQLEYFNKNRVIDEECIARRKRLKELKEFLDKGE